MAKMMAFDVTLYGRVLQAAGAVKSRGSTAGAARTTTLHPAGVSGAGLTDAGIPRDRE